MIENFIDPHAKKNNRTWHETKRILERYVLPEWHDLNIGDIIRDHVTVLLDRSEQGKIEYVKKGTTELLDSATQRGVI